MVNPISFGPSGINSQADFSPLAKLPEIYQQAQARQVLSTLQRRADGSFDTSPLFASGDMNLAKLGMELERNTALEGRDKRDFDFRVQGRTQDQANVDRTYNAGREDATAARALQERTAARLEDKTPPNYVQNPAVPGAVMPVAGGPADPQEQLKILGLKREEERKQRAQDATVAGLTPGTPEYQHFMATGTYREVKPKELSDRAADKIAEKGGSLEDFTRLKTGFKDEYGGFKTEFAGDVANKIASTTGYLNPERADWWRDYQTQKNIVRNKLFGSALTAPEKAEFDKSNINSSMTPATIKANIALQHDAARRAAKKLVDFHVKAGHNQEQIEAALGMPLSELLPPQAARPAPAAAAAPDPLGLR